MSSNSTVVHWFRKGLRLHDNPALVKAITIATQENCKLRPVFFLDPSIKKWLRVGRNRWIFLQETLIDLDENLRKINSRLYVYKGDPKTSFSKVFKEWNVTTLTFEHDIEPYSVERDAIIEDLAQKFKVKIIKEYSHTVFNPELIVKKNGGKPPMTFQKFYSVSRELKPPEPFDAPTRIPNSCKPNPDRNEIKSPNCYDPPTLEQLGIESDATIKFPGGEIEALRRFEENIRRKKYICEFEKPNTSPNSIDPSTTVLSPYLKFGCLSSRLFYKKLMEVYKGSKHSQPPVSLEGQLIWREFYYSVAAVTPNFDRMKGNPVCAQIPWENNEEFIDAWREGRTGYPFIDAIMRQLKQEGWIHHLARHAVACFLTRGDLWCNWEEGQKVFEEFLLDADWALNAGNWMWLSASAFFHQYYRVYSPVAFGKKTDPEGKFIRKYVPELKNYPSAVIYEPWKVSLDNQKRYKCIIGQDYPERIVDHDEVMRLNLAKMKAAYAKKKEGGTNEASTSTAAKRKIKDESISPSPKKASSKKAKSQSNTLKKYFK